MVSLTHFTDYEVEAGGIEALQTDMLEDDEEEEEGDKRKGGRREGGFKAQFEDAEDDAVDLEEPLSMLGEAKDYDALSFSPEELMAIMDEEDGADGTGAADADDDMDGEAADAVGEYKVKDFTSDGMWA